MQRRITEYIIDIATVSNITFYKLPYCTFWYTLIQLTETILFQSYVIIVIDIVNANDGSTFHISKQSLYQITTDKPSSTSNQ